MSPLLAYNSKSIIATSDSFPLIMSHYSLFIKKASGERYSGSMSYPYNNTIQYKPCQSVSKAKLPVYVPYRCFIKQLKSDPQKNVIYWKQILQYVLILNKLYSWTQLYTSILQLFHESISWKDCSCKLSCTGCPKKKCTQAYWVAFKNCMT